MHAQGSTWAANSDQQSCRLFQLAGLAGCCREFANAAVVVLTGARRVAGGAARTRVAARGESSTGLPRARRGLSAFCSHGGHARCCCDLLSIAPALPSHDSGCSSCLEFQGDGRQMSVCLSSAALRPRTFTSERKATLRDQQPAQPATQQRTSAVRASVAQERRLSGGGAGCPPARRPCSWASAGARAQGEPPPRCPWAGCPAHPATSRSPHDVWSAWSGSG